MERATIECVKEIFGDNFIGTSELKPFFAQFGLDVKGIILPQIKYKLDFLEQVASDYIIILGLPNLQRQKFSICELKNRFGIDPLKNEPCFYNQDWYTNEAFIHNTLKKGWYLIKREIIEETRAKQPEEILKSKITFPSAILCAYTFFAYYYARGSYLWHHDFIWCDDLDHNGDRIYVGKYHDIDGINRNGFSIHRHLALRSCYGSINAVN
jgi:hypothetical protein